jgi:hypothetical protein
MGKDQDSPAGSLGPLSSSAPHRHRYSRDNPEEVEYAGQTKERALDQQQIKKSSCKTEQRREMDATSWASCVPASQVAKKTCSLCTNKERDWSS